MTLSTHTVTRNALNVKVFFIVDNLWYNHQLFWVPPYNLIKKKKKKEKDAKCKMCIWLTRHLGVHQQNALAPAFQLQLWEGCSQRRRPAVPSSPTWLQVVSDRGLLLVRGICGWHHSWVLSGGGGLWGCLDWHSQGAAG